MTDEWRFPNRATPLGSSSYYSLRFAPAALRDNLAVLLAWRHLVYAVLDDVSDPHVARLKLQWWRDELERTVAGRPQHPLSKVLRPVLEQYELPAAIFIGIVDRVESEVLRKQPANEMDLDAACDQDLGGLFELIARCHGLDNTGLLETARKLGGFCARVYLIRNSGALARKGRAFAPAEQLNAHGVSETTLIQREKRDNLPNLLETAAFHARAKLAVAEDVRRMPACIRARTRILQSLLNEIECDGFDVADQHIGLTPLRKLWLAWRESRR